MTDMVEVSRADLETLIVAFTQDGIESERFLPALERLRQHVKPKTCGVKAHAAQYDGGHRVTCVLPPGHDGHHQIDPELWDQPKRYVAGVINNARDVMSPDEQQAREKRRHDLLASMGQTG